MVMPWIFNKAAKYLNTKFNPHTVHWIYDTSFLMSGAVHGFEAITPEAHIIRREIILDCVKNEVANNIKSDTDDVAKFARIARGRVAEITQRCSNFEIDYENELSPYVSSNILGSDSKADKIILALAVRIAMETAKNIAIIVTNDGGIVNDVVDIRRSIPGADERLFFYSKHDDAFAKKKLHEICYARGGVIMIR